MYRIMQTICLTALLLTGCATLPPPPVAVQQGPIAGSATTNPSQTTSSPLVDVEWNLIEIRPAGGEALLADGSPKFSVLFGADGRFGGQLDCNRVMGSYSVDGDTLTLGPIASTMAFCQDDPLYSPYSEAINSITTYRIVDDRLYIAYAQGELVFVPNPMY